MTKFHINANGDAGPCAASIRDCKFGEDSHFDDKAGAQLAVEQRLEELHGITAPPLKKFRDKLAKALNAVEGFAESVDSRHKQDMEEIRDLARQRRLERALDRV